MRTLAKEVNFTVRPFVPYIWKKIYIHIRISILLCVCMHTLSVHVWIISRDLATAHT